MTTIADLQNREVNDRKKTASLTKEWKEAKEHLASMKLSKKEQEYAEAYSAGWSHALARLRLELLPGCILLQQMSLYGYRSLEDSLGVMRSAAKSKRSKTKKGRKQC